MLYLAYEYEDVHALPLPPRPLPSIQKLTSRIVHHHLYFAMLQCKASLVRSVLSSCDNARPSLRCVHITTRLGARTIPHYFHP